VFLKFLNDWLHEKYSSDLILISALVFSTDDEVDNLADVDISTKSGIESLGNAVIKKIRSTERLEKKPFYAPFLESFCKDLCLNCKSLNFLLEMEISSFWFT